MPEIITAVAAGAAIVDLALNVYALNNSIKSGDLQGIRDSIAALNQGLERISLAVREVAQVVRDEFSADAVRDLVKKLDYYNDHVEEFLESAKGGTLSDNHEIRSFAIGIEEQVNELMRHSLCHYLHVEAARVVEFHLHKLLASSRSTVASRSKRYQDYYSACLDPKRTGSIANSISLVQDAVAELMRIGTPFDWRETRRVSHRYTMNSKCSGGHDEVWYLQVEGDLRSGFVVDERVREERKWVECDPTPIRDLAVIAELLGHVHHESNGEREYSVRSPHFSGISDARTFYKRLHGEFLRLDLAAEVLRAGKKFLEDSKNSI